MFRVALFLVGLLLFGGSLHQCFAHKRTYNCSRYATKQKDKDNECYGKTPGEHEKTGIFSDVEALEGMAGGAVLILIAALGRKKK